MQNTVAKGAVVGSGSIILTEISEDGKELLFYHGVPYFTVTNPDVLSVVSEWESRALVAEWKLNFGFFDCISRKFFDTENQERQSKKYVGVPGINAICRALCYEPGVESNFNVGVGKFEWIEQENLWLLTGLDGQNLGHFKGVVATDKNIVSPRFREITGQSPLLDLSYAPEFVKLLDIPVPAKGFSFTNSKVLSWAFCESSKPGRCCTRGSAFPAASIAKEEKCLWDEKKRMAICGDFCVSPNVEGAILSGLAAATKLKSILIPY
ncbi:hypothetical protein PTKIN_Ptkin12aG0074500 [Pterospermum kingtungense]